MNTTDKGHALPNNRHAADDRHTSDFEQFLTILDLKADNDVTYSGAHPTKNPQRTFGGQLMAQALIAGGRAIVNSCPPATLTAHFISGGNPNADIQYRVTLLRDERRFVNQRVDATQGDALLATALISYLNVGRSGLEHDPPRPEVSDPTTLASGGEDLPSPANGTSSLFSTFFVSPFEWRYANNQRSMTVDTDQRQATTRGWFRTLGTLPEDPLLHTAAMVYCSDMNILDPIFTTHGLNFGHDRIFAVTVNHSIWFHRQAACDKWILYSTQSPVATASRGLGTGQFTTLDGRLLATVVQEGIVTHFPR
ncbi:MAG: acyl-CoA thioesterase [Mycolicibacterium sp.]|uniref:acyl-CoA thioesterase n=1 Tax=Mycolicibacterium sp. TaxID=2320850 RepID=UPI003D108682